VSAYEHDEEPVRGLPGHLPAGERIVWQGAPDWRVLARTAFHTRTVAIYFAVLLVAAIVHTATGASMLGLLATMGVGVAGLGLLHLLAWLTARSTIYTITNKRVVLRFGVALAGCVNVPFKIVATAGLELRADGTGDIPMALVGDGRIAYPHLWPYARPWKLTRPEPMLRAVPDAAKVAGILSAALADAVPEGRRFAVVEPVPAGAPGFGDAVPA